MRKILLFIVCACGLLSSIDVKAQATFTTQADTVYMSITTGATVPDYITNITSSALNLKWRVSATNFPSDWTDSAALGICDNSLCRQNGTSGQLWNGTSGTAFSATYGANSTDDSMGDFHLALNFASATSTGSHYLNVFVQDVTSGIGGYSKTMTFIINKIPAAVTNINNPENNIVLYPNTAHDEVNVVYDQGADVKNIAVYNIIGKVLAVYKVTNNTSANLNLENIPSGIYFVRRINSPGDVVVTRKFTKQ